MQYGLATSAGNRGPGIFRRQTSVAIEIVGANLCGFNPATSGYYKNKTTYEKLRNYNGVVNSQYPDEVLKIMESF